MDLRTVFAVLLVLLAQASYSNNAAAVAVDNMGKERSKAGKTTSNMGKERSNAGKATSNLGNVTSNAGKTTNNADKSTNNAGELAAASPLIAQIIAQKPQVLADPAFTGALNRGIELFNNNRPNDALVEFLKALELNKNNTAVRNWMGATYQKMNKHKEAAEVYEEVVRIDPDYAEAHNNLAYSYQQMQNYEKAEPEYKRALELKPDFIEARFNLACVLQLEKKNDAAITEFETVLKADPSRTDCFIHIGDVAKENKDFDKALLYYNKAMAVAKTAGQKDPQSMADILCALSLIDKEKGDRAKCKEGLEKVLDLDPGSYLAHLNLGILAYEDRNFSTSLGYLGKALERNPYDAAVHFWLGRYYFSLDSMKNSIKQFSDCQKCDASEHKFPECQEWIDKAKKKQATY